MKKESEWKDLKTQFYIQPNIIYMWGHDKKYAEKYKMLKNTYPQTLKTVWDEVNMI